MSSAWRAAGRIDERDCGLATVWAAAGMALVVALTTVGVNLAAAIGSRHRAEAAADLAALAAASHAADGDMAACAHGARVTERMSARLVSCRLSGSEARVEVEVRSPLTLGGLGVAHGRARAGPSPG